MGRSGLFGGKSTLIFDLDGTLVDTDAIHRHAYERALAGYGVQHFDYRRFRGHRTEEVIRTVFARDGIAADPATIDEAVRRKQSEARKLMTNGLVPVAGAPQFVRRVAEAGFRLAVATGASREGAARCLDEVGLSRFFEAVVTADDVSRGKPAPDIFLRAVELLDVEKAECLIIEDSPSGIAAARAAEIDVVLICVPLPGDRGAAPISTYAELSREVGEPSGSP